MSPELERRYRWLLRAYPARFRGRHQAEMLGTLAQSARPGQRFPSPREAAGLLAGGLRAHAMAGGGGTASGVLADGIYLGVLLLHAIAAGVKVADALVPSTGWMGDAAGVPDGLVRDAILSSGFDLVVVAALLRGRLKAAIAVVVVRALALQAFSSELAAGNFGSSDSLALQGAVLAWGLYPAAALAALAIFGGRTSWRPRPLPPLWLTPLCATMLAVVGYRLVISPELIVGLPNLNRLQNSFGVVLAGAFLLALVALAAVDPRLPVAFAFCASSLLLVFILFYLTTLPGPYPGGPMFRPAIYLELIGLVLAPFAAGALGTRRLASI
jgi:hypothetical protein